MIHKIITNDYVFEVVIPDKDGAVFSRSVDVEWGVGEIILVLTFFAVKSKKSEKATQV